MRYNYSYMLKYFLKDAFNIFPEKDEFNTSEICLQLNSAEWTEEHAHSDFWEFLIVLDGEINHFINAKKMRLKKGILCLLRPDDVHYIKNADSGKLKYANIGVHDRLMRQFFDLIDTNLYLLLKENGEILFEINDDFVYWIEKMFYNYFLFPSESFKKREFHKKTVLSALINTLLNHVSEQTSYEHYPKPIAEIIRALDAQKYLNLTVGQICEAVSYSRNQINNLFKKHLNQSPKDFLVRTKINYACYMLKSTSRKILDIASDVGYNSLGHFNAAFKSQIGIMPKAYRKQFF